MNFASIRSGVQTFLRHKNFALFLSSRVLSTLAGQMLAVAVGWQMYSLTGSAFYLGLVGLAQFLPMLLLTFVVGHVADRYDRRRVVRISQAVQGVGVLVLAWGSLGGWIQKESLLLIVVLLGAARSFEGPSMQALMRGLVSTEMFPKAVAWNAASFQTASILGPALGGLIYAAGGTFAYSVIGALLLTASLLLTGVRIETPPPKPEPPSLKSIFAGLEFIWSKPAVLGAISLDLFAVLLGGATALLPIYAREILFIGGRHIGSLGLGILRAAPAVGALIVSVFLARRPVRRRVGRVMFAAVAVFGLATIVFAVSRSFWLSLATLIVLGAADVFSVVIRSSLVQLETPDEMRGRVSAVNSLFIGTSNQLGEFESGITAAWFGTVPAVLIGGFGTLAVVGVWMKLFPQLAKADRFEQTKD